MRFYKMQGTGNDFVIVDEIQNPQLMSSLTEHGGSIEAIRKNIAIKLCSEFGTDGIMYVLRSENSDAMMRIFNSDGSEALMCGNGLRCFGRYVLDMLDRDLVEIETLKAVYNVRRVYGFYEDMEGFEIALNNVVYHGKTNAVLMLERNFSNYDFEFYTVSNPHVVVMTDSIPEDELLNEIGGYSNSSESPFADGVNVNFATCLSEDSIYVRTYERGVGITKSCGTGMTSSVTRFAKNNNLFDKWIDIYNDGGMIKCKVNKKCADSYEVQFVGNATHEYYFDLDPERLLSFNGEDVICVMNQVEINQYNEFLKAVSVLK